MDIIARVNELRDIYVNDSKETLRDYKEEVEKINANYKEEVAKEKITELKSNSIELVRSLYNKYISELEKVINLEEGILKNEKIKKKDSLEFSNQLLKLSLIKDNKKALKREIENNKEDTELLGVVKDMSFKDTDILTLLGNIENNSRKGMLEKGKRIYNYEKINGLNLEVFNTQDTSRFEL